MTSIKDLSNIIVNVVCEYFDVSIGEITSKRSNANVVDARQFAVYILSCSGYRTSYIADLMNVSPRYVNTIISTFNTRIKHNLVLNSAYEAIRNKLRTATATIT